MKTDKPPRLLFLTVMPSPYQQQLFARMAESGQIDVRVLYYAAGAPDRMWKESKLHPHEKVLAGSTIRLVGDSAHWNPSALSEVGRAAPDLVVVSDYSAPTAQAVMRALAVRRQPFVFWGEVPGFARRGAIGSWIRSRLQDPLTKASAIAAIGEGAVEAYSRLFPKVRVVNIPYFCDLEPYRRAASLHHDDPSDDVTVLFSGQLIDRKGVDLLLEAFSRAAAKDRRLRLQIVGEGPQRRQLEAAVPEALANRVTFLGHQQPPALPGLFAAADVFCLPSRHDGWGVVVNEALGAGLPIIVSQSVGAGRDIVRQDVNGFITQTGSVDELERALIALTDDTLRKQMTKQAKAIAAEWDLDQGVNKWRQLAAEVLGGTN